MQKLRNWTYQNLRKSEGFFKTDMVYLAKGGFWLNASQAGALLASFILSIGFANLLTQHDYGIYKYILSVASVLGALSLSGLPTALIRATARGFDGSLLYAFWLNIRWSLIIVAASGVAALYYSLNGNTTLAIGLLIAGTMGSVLDSAELYNSFLYGKKYFRTAGSARVIRAAIASAGLFATLIFTDNPLYIVFFYYALHSLIALAIFNYVLKTKRANDSIDPEISYLTKHTSLMNNFAAVADTIDNILIFHYLGAAQLAIYNFARAMPEQLAGFLKNINVLAIPKFADRDKTEIQKSLSNKSLKIFVVGLMAMITYTALSPLVFQNLFPQYVSSIHYSQVYSLILLFSAVLPLAFLDSQVAIKQKYTINVLSNIVKIALIFGGIYFYGIWGAIVARIISKIFGVSLAFIFAFKV